MRKPVALIGHQHICPMTVPRPHIGGPVITGQTSVKIDGVPVAVVGDKTVCIGVPCKDAVVRGSSIARINGKPIARVGDRTSHGGRITQGAFGVRCD